MARPSRPRLFALAALLPLSLACSELEHTCARDAHTAYEARAPFDARARVRRVDCGFHSGVQNLTTLPDGSAWLRRTEYKDLGDDSFFLPPEKRLTHVGPGGELRADIVVPDFLLNIVAHPSGEVSVLGWEKQEDATKVQAVRLAADGSQLVQRVLSNDTPVAERLNYEAFPDGRLEKVEAPREGRYFTLLTAVAHGEDVYVLAGADGLRLLKLNSRLEVLWSRPVTPTVALREFTDVRQIRALGVPLAGWLLAVDEEGRVHTAHHFLDFQRRAHAEALGRTPEGTTARGILLSRFDSTGALLAERTIPTPQVDELTGLVVRGGAYALGARALTPVDQEDKPTEADLYFASGRWDGPADALVQRTLSLDKDDSAGSFIACGEGRFCFAGHTGYLELTTGRTNTNGQGFILALDARGEQQDLLLLQGERDTEVLRAAEGPGGSVVFSFITNQAANLGRVGNKFKNNETWVGVFGGP